MIVYLLFLLGIVFLAKSADWIVDSSSSIAKRFGISELIIGLTVVAFGTSLPELVVNVMAALSGSGEIAFGNVVGSNIANILLVLGITACLGNIKLERETVWHEIPFALLSAFVLFAMVGNLFGVKEFLTRDDGLILLGLFGIFLYYVFLMAQKNRKKFDVGSVVDKSGVITGLKLGLGLVGIYLGGKWVVEGAVVIAGLLGMSEFLISATIIAIGTSLPELVVSVLAVRRGNVGLAVGNVIGSNIFNICWVLGIVPLVNPIAIPSYVGFDVGIMFLATFVLFMFMFIGKKHELRRPDGVLMLIGYVAYIWFVVVRG